ncbi:MAG: hypothetical protein GY801_12840 [bacterium]|nr:hypothetical protein [bacterium]
MEKTSWQKYRQLADARICADFFQKHRKEIDGVIILQNKLKKYVFTLKRTSS